MKQKLYFRSLLLGALLSLSSVAWSQTQSASGLQRGTPVKPSPGQAFVITDANGDEKAKVGKQNYPSTAIENRNPADEKIVIGTRLVNVRVTALDSHNRFMTGLSREHFDVFDNQVKQQIAHFSDEDAPLSLGIIYDVSGSMEKHISRSLAALRRFIETSHEDDDFFLITFNNRANLAQDFTTSADQLLRRLTVAAPKGATAVYDAVYLGLEKLRQGRHPRKALLIISDGQDNNSRYSFKELRNLIKEADVQIYAIGITSFMADSLARFGRSVLEEITEVTGGRAFFPDADRETGLIEICTRIALELRHQYTLGFYPTSTAPDAKWHKLKVRVKVPKGTGRVSLSHRQGYPPFQK